MEGIQTDLGVIQRSIIELFSEKEERIEEWTYDFTLSILEVFKTFKTVGFRVSILGLQRNSERSS